MIEINTMINAHTTSLRGKPAISCKQEEIPAFAGMTTTGHPVETQCIASLHPPTNSIKNQYKNLIIN